MVEGIKQLLMAVLRLPRLPPAPPGGAHAHVQVLRASPRLLTYRTVVWLLGFAPYLLGITMALGATLASQQHAAVGVVVGAAVFAGLMLVAQYVGLRLDYDLRYYVITDKSLRIREGAWVVRELTLSYVNVQNVSIEQGPIERALGIANVIVDTAGGGSPSAKGELSEGHRGVLRGLTNAAEVRDLIRRRLLAAHQDAGLGDADAPSAAAPDQAALLEQVLAEAKGLARAAQTLPP